jgi:MFS transporter, CP family, cyanate transporter
VLLAVANLVGAAGALVAPAAAGRLRTQRPLVAVVLAAYLVGLGGLLLAPGTGTLVWVALFGVAQGGGFALALTLIVLRSATPLVAARLGGVAQCVGYLVAAAGPVVLGALHDATGGWHWPLGLLLALLVPMALTGWGAARDAVLGDEPVPTVPFPTSAERAPGAG